MALCLVSSACGPNKKPPVTEPSVATLRAEADRNPLLAPWSEEFTVEPPRRCVNSSSLTKKKVFFSKGTGPPRLPPN